MNKINRKLEYALIALKHMRTKQPGELTTAKEVCSLYTTPFDATARVLQIMAQKGLLKSEQGAHGGYLILRDLTKVNLYDLIESILGPIEMAKCLQLEPGQNSTCEIFDTCNIVSPIHILNKRLVDFYQGVTLGELFDSRSSRQMGAPVQAVMESSAE